MAGAFAYRDEHYDPGDMIHLDIKKLGRFVRTRHRITGDRTGQSNTRGVGGESLHVCVDSAARSRRGSTTYIPVGVDSGFCRNDDMDSYG